MLFNKKIISVAASFLLAATASVDSYQFSPQVALQNARYESQGFRILSSENVDNYSIRIKQPKSCESGVQVICEKKNNDMPTSQILIFMTVLWLHWQARYQRSFLFLLFRVKNRPWEWPYCVVVEWRSWLFFHDGIMDGIRVSYSFSVESIESKPHTIVPVKSMSMAMTLLETLTAGTLLPMLYF